MPAGAKSATACGERFRDVAEQMDEAEHDVLAYMAFDESLRSKTSTPAMKKQVDTGPYTTRPGYDLRDNIFVERLWRTLKYECVYLYAWESVLAGSCRHPRMGGVLQSPTPAFRSWWKPAGHDLLAVHRSKPTR